VAKVIAMASDSTSAGRTNDTQSLYERDYYTWALEQARALKEHRLEELDWENLSDEVESLAKTERRELQSLAKTERRELRSRLELLLEHLLKWQFQASRGSRSWRTTVTQQRLKIREHLHESPGLNPSLGEVMAQAYKIARIEVTGRYLRRSDPQPPESCPWTYEQVMDEQFWLE
jgi:hypothetical protein